MSARRAPRAPREMTARQVNQELDALERQACTLTDRFIVEGRGYERVDETARKTDPLAAAWNAMSARRMALRIEVEARFGPGAPRRLPTSRASRATLRP